MRQIALIAGKELRDGLRNRWVLAITLLLALFALTLSFLGAAPTGSVKVSPLAVTIVSLSSLSIFLLPMITLLLSYDAIIGEWERGTLGLLLAYPVARWQVMLGTAMSAFSRLRPCLVTARRVWPRCSIPGIWQTTGVTSQHW